jgi:hypothetical protein
LNGGESVSNDEYNRDDIKTRWKRKDQNSTINAKKLVSIDEVLLNIMSIYALGCDSSQEEMK